MQLISQLNELNGDMQAPVAHETGKPIDCLEIGTKSILISSVAWWNIDWRRNYSREWINGTPPDLLN